MEAQSQIKRTLSQPQSIESIRRLLADGSHTTRSSVARAACSHFGFFDARGHPQSAGCIKALRELEQAGHFALPAVQPSGRGKGKTARRLEAPVPEPLDVPAQAGGARELALIKVGTQWAAHEFGGARLGDERLSDRLVHSVDALAAMPGRAFCGAAQGDKAAVKAYYRLIDKPDDSQVTMGAILAPQQRNIGEKRGARVELLVRAKHDRVTAGPSHLFESLRGSPVKEKMLIDVPRQSTRPKKSKQKAMAGHPGRKTRTSPGMPALVRPEIAHRRLASRAQERLPN